MRKDAIVLIVVVLAVTLMITSAVMYSRKQGAIVQPPAASGGSASLQGEVKGVMAPDFTLKTLDGKDVKLSDYRGKAVLLNFWATWCQPCKVEMPWFQELQKQYAEKGLQVVGVAMDDAEPDKIAAFAKEMGVTYQILKGKEAVGEQYGGVQFLPTTFFIDREGKIVDRVFGLVSHSEIEGNIKKSLGADAAAATVPATTAAQPVEAK